MAGGYEFGSGYVTVLPSTRDFGRNLGRDLDGPFSEAGRRGGQQVSDGVSQGGRGGFAAAGGALGKVFIGAFAAIGAAGIVQAAVGWLQDAIDAASNLSETQAKTGEIFGDSAKGLIDYSKTAASRLGQSQQTVLDGAATFGIFGKSAGLAGQDLVGFSTGMVELATDLASFNNTTPEQAIEAIGAALRGETEPMRAYGVLLDDATLRNRALALGLITTTKEALTPQQKVLAAHAEILAQTGTAQGDFGRTSDGLANQQRILAAEMENVKVEIGTALLPVVTDLFRMFASEGVPILQKIATWFSENEDAIRTFAVVSVESGLTILEVLLRMGAGWASFQGMLIGGLQTVVGFWFLFVQSILDGAVQAFGWVPGLGPKLKGAADGFRGFAGDVNQKMDEMQVAAQMTSDLFNKGADAVGELKAAVASLDGKRATVFLNAQGNLVRDNGDGSFRVQGTNVAFRASGGPVSSGMPYIVGEQGPELFVPGNSGRIVSNQNLTAAGGRVAGLPDSMVLLDRDGSILARTEVIAGRAVGAYEQGGRDLSSARGLRWIAKGR